MRAPIFCSTIYLNLLEYYGGRRGSMSMEDLQCIRHSPLFCVYDRTWLGQGKSLK